MIGGGNIEAAFSFYEQGQLLRTGARFSEKLFFAPHRRVEADPRLGYLLHRHQRWRFDCFKHTVAPEWAGVYHTKLAYHYATTMLCRLLRIPKELFFMGECGEYELLFAISPEDEQDFLEEAQELNLKFSLIGEFVPDDDRLLVENDKVLNLAECDCSARDFPSKKDYLNKLLGFLGHGPLKI
jgi:thiamine-monophosphate kinase